VVRIGLPRRRPARGEAFPASWAHRRDLPIISDARAAVVVHVFYPQLLDEILGHVALIPIPVDLILTNASGVELSVDQTRMPTVRACVTLGVENRGRDLWPLAQLVNAGLIDRYDLVAKVHTKRSGWRDAHEGLSGTGTAWRADLLSAMLGDEASIREILDAFEVSPELGMVTADGSVLGPGFWGRDREMAESLLRRIGLRCQPASLRFAAGSMYWTRAAILRRLGDLGLSSADFEDERGQVDGTTAHALERVIGLLSLDAGLRIVERSRLVQAAEATS
jgi:lipopolysaccharide biosynthesis protein